MDAISPARKAAFQILIAVERGRAHSDDLLRGKHVNALSQADRNLATALVLGTLRWQIQLDAEIKGRLKKPGARIDTEVLIALRLGAFQLLHLDRIPARAAVDDSVELAKQAGHRFASGMVNAVLRKLTNASRAERGENNAAKLALTQGHPQWMVERWLANYGLDQACAICGHGQKQPATTLRITGLEVEAELAQAGVQVEPASLLANARNVAAGDVTATVAFREGRLRIQDEGSQLVAEIAASAGADRGGSSKFFLDACAAPGGKTLILLERDPQAHIVACEASVQRLAQLQKRLAGFSNRIECRHTDAALLEENDRFDLVLADVPCSGTGTLGRNPEIRHRLHADDLPRQVKRQRAILNSALRAIRSGGRVVYSTCSLEPEENDQVVAAALADYTSARQVSLATTIEKMAAAGILVAWAAKSLQECLTPEGALRLLPGEFGTDGFFVALLESTDQPC